MKDSITDEKKVCAGCGKTIEGYGNNGHPVFKGTVCDDCNRDYVVPERIARILQANAS